MYLYIYIIYIYYLYIYIICVYIYIYIYIYIYVDTRTYYSPENIPRYKSQSLEQDCNRVMNRRLSSPISDARRHRERRFHTLYSPLELNLSAVTIWIRPHPLLHPHGHLWKDRNVPEGSAWSENPSRCLQGLSLCRVITSILWPNGDS